MLLRHEPNPGWEVAARSEGLWIGNGSNYRSGQHRADAGSLIEPPARLIGPVPGHNHTVELKKLLLEPLQLSSQSRETGTSYLRNASIGRIGDNPEQLLDTLAPDRGNDSKLCEMGADHINHCGLLADEQMARTMEHQATLLLHRLGLDELHIGPGDGLADRLCVSRIVLLSLNVWLDVGRRHQAHPMPKRLQLPRPMMRRRAGLNTNKASWQLFKKGQQVTPFQLPPNDHLAIGINAMDLKHRLRNIEADRLNCLHNWLLSIVGALNSTHFHGTHVPVEEPSTASKADSCSAATHVC